MKHLISNDLSNTAVKRSAFISTVASVAAGTLSLVNSSQLSDKLIGYEVTYWNADRTEFLGFDRVDYRNLPGLSLITSKVYKMIILNSARYDCDKVSLFTDFISVPVLADWLNTIYHFINPPMDQAFQYDINSVYLYQNIYSVDESPAILLTYNHK